MAIERLSPAQYHQDEVKPCLQVNSLRSHNPNGGISIRDRSTAAAEPSQPVSAEEKQQQSDADYARQLQAKLDAQEARGGTKSGTLPFCCMSCFIPQACTFEPVCDALVSRICATGAHHVDVQLCKGRQT